MHLKYWLLIYSLLALPASAFGIEPDWSGYDLLLDKYVSEEVRSGIPVNWVDYSGIGHDPAFKKIVQSIETFPVEQLEGHAEILSFYINAYNILAIKMVLDHWPVSSIKDAGTWFKPVWDKPAGIIGGRQVTLGMIEHDILRPMGEPRIHKAIVCASLSCPDLRKEAYRAGILEEQLEDQTQRFLENTAKGLRVEKGKVIVSRIFDWFKEDFSVARGVEVFIRNYIDIPRDILLEAVIPYNWDLNGD